jgi:hypothetical protein
LRSDDSISQSRNGKSFLERAFPGPTWFVPAVIFVLLLISTLSFAQKPGTVSVTADHRIDSLLSKRLAINREAARGSFISADGFRVQIFSGSERSQAYAEQARFKSMYPLVGSYINYNQPNYKIRVGDFRTRMEAEKFMHALRPAFPSLFIFSEKINLPR